MSTYAPASSFGWLDFDAVASERVGTLLRALEEPGILDPLGLGSVRDAFATMLSPGTSTIQTRLRYFLFLPWIFRRLEVERVPPTEFVRRLRDDEARLIDCLRHLGSNQGVIGYNAGRNLKRMPSDVYWGGLGAWGIRRHDLSLTQYGRRVAALGRHRADRDDDGYATISTAAMWGPLPPPPDDFLCADISFELRRDEAEVLVEHIAQRHPESLLALLCKMPDLAAGLSFPWERPPAALLHHAQCFSELTLGPQYVYNILLARKAKEEFGWDTDELEEDLLREVDWWVELISERYDSLRAWVRDIPAFWALLRAHNIGASTQGFVEEIANQAVTNPAGFTEDQVVHACIRNREIRLKSKRARLGQRTALENWNQDPFGGQLDYRWPTTRSYLADIATALKAGD